MGIRDWLARQGKASLVPLPASEQADVPLERVFDDATLLSTYADDAWVYILTNKVASQASQARLEIGVLDADKQFTPTPDDPVQALLDLPNPLMDGGEFIHLLLLYMEMTGHAPIEVARSRGAKKPLELYPHNPAPWRIVANRDRTIRGYLYLLESGDVKWRPQDMTYIRWPNPNDPFYGQGRLQAVRQELMTEEYAAQRAKNFEKRYGVPPGVLSSELPISDTTATEMQMRWEKAVGGYRNAGRIAVLGSKLTYQPIGLNAHEGEWLEQRRWNVDTLAGALEIPIPLIRMDGSTFSNVEGARAELWEGNIQPKLDRIARMLTVRLLPLLGVTGKVLRFDYSEVDALGENELEAAKTATEWTHTGAARMDEVRKKLGLKPLGGELGDRLIIPTTLALQSETDITAPPEPPTAPQPPAAPDPAPQDRPAPAKAYKAARPEREVVLAPIRSSYMRDLSGYFAAQRNALVPLVGKTGAHDAQRGALKDNTDLIERVIAVLRSSRFAERLRQISRDPLGAAIDLGAIEAAATLGITADFSIEASEDAIARLTTHLNLLDAGITNTTVNDVRTLLEGALRNQLTNAEIRTALGELFDGYEAWRLDRIARTELTNAYNLGSIGQYRSAGVALVRVVDGDGDEICAQANGSLWTLDDAEGDPSGHPNCTRTFIPDTAGLLAAKPRAVKAEPIIPPITVNVLNQEAPRVPTRTVIDRDEAGDFIGYHEEAIGG